MAAFTARGRGGAAGARAGCHGEHGQAGGRLVVTLSSQGAHAQGQDQCGRVQRYDPQREGLLCAAPGGRGGDGSRGRCGMPGRDGRDGYRNENGQGGQDGQNGGNGGDGGAGGDGGEVHVTVCDYEAELLHTVQVDVSAGHGGSGGCGGEGGAGGRGGRRGAGDNDAMTLNGRDGARGRKGAKGQDGPRGRDGAASYTLVDPTGHHHSFPDVFSLRLADGAARVHPRHPFLEPGGVYTVAGITARNEASMPLPALARPYRVFLDDPPQPAPFVSLNDTLGVPPVAAWGAAEVPGGLSFRVAQPAAVVPNAVFTRDTPVTVCMAHERLPGVARYSAAVPRVTVGFPVRLGVVVGTQFEHDTHGAVVAGVPVPLTVEVRNYGGEHMAARRTKVRFSVRHTSATRAYQGHGEVTPPLQGAAGPTPSAPAWAPKSPAPLPEPPKEAWEASPATASHGADYGYGVASEAVLDGIAPPAPTYPTPPGPVAPSAPALPNAPPRGPGVTLENAATGERVVLCDAMFDGCDGYECDMAAFPSDCPAAEGAGFDAATVQFALEFDDALPEYTPCEVRVELLLEDRVHGQAPPVFHVVQAFAWAQAVSRVFRGFPSFFNEDECFLGQNFPEASPPDGPHGDITTQDIEDDFVDVALLGGAAPGPGPGPPPAAAPGHGFPATPPPFDVLLCVHHGTPRWVIDKMEGLHARAGLTTALYDLTLCGGLGFGLRDGGFAELLRRPGGGAASGLTLCQYLKGKCVVVDYGAFTGRSVDAAAGCTVFAEDTPAALRVEKDIYTASWSVGVHFMCGAAASAAPAVEGFMLAGRETVDLKHLASPDMRFPFPSYPPACELRYVAAVEDNYVKLRQPNDDHLHTKMQALLDAMATSHPDLRFAVGVHAAFRKLDSGLVLNTWRLGTARVNVAPRNRVSQHVLKAARDGAGVDELACMPVYFEVVSLLSLHVKLQKLRDAACGFHRKLFMAAVVAELVRELHLFFAADTSTKYTEEGVKAKKVYRDWDVVARACLAPELAEALLIKYEAALDALYDASGSLFHSSRFRALCGVVRARLKRFRAESHIQGPEHAAALRRVKEVYAQETVQTIIRMLLAPYSSGAWELLGDKNRALQLRVGE